jgi:hypothetical protein
MSKIGRNAPCPCGSGRKYKKCCLQDDEASRAAAPPPLEEKPPPLGVPPDLGGLFEEDPPVVDEDGFRIVGSAKALADFARPLFETLADSDPHLPFALAQVCWNIAVTPEGGREPLRRELESQLERAGVSEPRELVDTLVARHEAMYPQGGRIPGRPLSRFVRQRWIDDLPAWTPFDEPALESRLAAIETDAADDATRAILESLDELAHGAPEAMDHTLPTASEALERSFVAWLGRSGVEEGTAGLLAELAGLFVGFVYRYAGEALSATVEVVVHEFLTRWIFRKTSLPGGEMSAAPTALRALGHYLDAIGLTEDLAANMAVELEEVEEEFADWLHRFHGPPSMAGH